MVLTGTSSKQSSLVKRLAAELPALLARPAKQRPVRKRQVQRRLTAEEVERLVAEYQAGADMKQLAQTWAMHRTTVAAQLRKAGVELRRQGVPDERLQEAVRLYAEGWSLQRLAERYGCDAETVRTTLKLQDVRMRKPWERG